MLLLSSAIFFFRINFLKKSFRNTIRVSNSLDNDQDSHFVGPDLDPTHSQILSAVDRMPRLPWQELKMSNHGYLYLFSHRVRNLHNLKFDPHRLADLNRS